MIRYYRVAHRDIEPKDIFEKLRSLFKNRILVQDRGGAEFKTAGNLMVVEDLKQGTNKDIELKDIFEKASKVALRPYLGYNKNRSGFKTPSEVQWLRCRPPINAHILCVCCAFSIGLQLAEHL